MSKGSKSFTFSVEAGVFFLLLGVLVSGWVVNGPSNQELLANYAKAKDLWDLIVINKGFAWWTPNYLGGAPTAPLAGTGLTMFWMVLGGAFNNPILGCKVLGFLSLAVSGVLMAAFIRRLTVTNVRVGLLLSFTPSDHRRPSASQETSICRLFSLCRTRL
jgi:hypothetical protein